MTTDAADEAPTPDGGGTEPLPLPWFGPTLHELVPGIPPGARPPALRKEAARALTAARHDPARQDRLRRADHASRGAVAALVAEMLTPPLPRHDAKDLP
ncbi:hypothetical protein [Streptomyces sp. NPDC003717]|uniref:hypothetical protein n=1 Tax=Streptomyces sp. NPDC003717 TaxID=3154276 RepID=UPI0033BD861B